MSEKPRLYSTAEMRIGNSNFAPIEQLLQGGTVSLGGRSIDSKSFVSESVRTGELDPRFFVPQSLSENISVLAFHRTCEARRSGATFPLVTLFNDSSMSLVHKEEVLPVGEISPVSVKTRRIMPAWRVHLRSYYGMGKDVREILEKLELEDYWKDCISLTKTDEGELFAVADPDFTIEKEINEI